MIGSHGDKNIRLFGWMDCAGPDGAAVGGAAGSARDEAHRARSRSPPNIDDTES